MTGFGVPHDCVEASAARSALDEAVRRAFWQSLHRQPLPPMLALQVAARALGTLYRQMAAAHEGPSCCTCGWRPDRDGDLVVLEADLASALLQPPGCDLAEMETVGRA